MSPLPLMANGRLHVGKLTSSSSTDSADTLQMGSPAASSTCWATLRCSTLKPAAVFGCTQPTCGVTSCATLACSRSHIAAISCTQRLLMSSTSKAAAAPTERLGTASSMCWNTAQELHLAVCSSTHAASGPAQAYALSSLPAQSAGMASHVRMQRLQKAQHLACSRCKGAMH